MFFQRQALREQNTSCNLDTIPLESMAYSMASEMEQPNTGCSISNTDYDAMCESLHGITQQLKTLHIQIHKLKRQFDSCGSWEKDLIKINEVGSDKLNESKIWRIRY